MSWRHASVKYQTTKRLFLDLYILDELFQIASDSVHLVDIEFPSESKIRCNAAAAGQQSSGNDSTSAARATDRSAFSGVYAFDTFWPNTTSYGPSCLSSSKSFSSRKENDIASWHGYPDVMH
jgi:hypothetical protein